MKEGDLVVVHWVDQSHYVGPTYAEGAIQECSGKSLGYFLEQNKDWLCIAAERFETDRISYRHIMTFPRVAIKSVTLLKGLKK